jgi:hypothetical protein
MKYEAYGQLIPAEFHAAWLERWNKSFITGTLKECYKDEKELWQETTVKTEMVAS